MASAVTTQKIGAERNLRQVFHVPGATSATVLYDGTNTYWFDMTGYNWVGFVVGTVVSASSSGPTLIEIVAADDSSGTNTVQVVSSVVASTAVNGSYFIECAATQVREVSAAAGYNSRYVSCRITTSNSGDKQCVLVDLDYPRAPQLNLTTNHTSGPSN